MGDFTEDLASYLFRHYVRLRCWDQTPGETANLNAGNGNPIVASGFILSVSGEWFWITAGHVMEWIDAQVGEGKALAKWSWDARGSMGSNEHELPVPFEYEPQCVFSLHRKSDGIDCALLHLKPHYRQQLADRGVVPISECAFGDLCGPYSQYCLVGTPDQLVSTDLTSRTLDLTDVVVPITRTYDPPQAIKRRAPRFYGEVSRRNLGNLRGISGGPIFGVQTELPGGRFAYWLIAIQSAAYDDTDTRRYIAGVSIVGFARFIAETLEKRGVPKVTPARG